MHRSASSLTMLVVTVLAVSANASDWLRFRGPNGSGLSPDSAPIPVTWSDTENLKWKAQLPGPGSSCPIVLGDRVFVTCWTGYGLDARDPGQQKDLRLHLLCLSRETGQQIWDAEVPATLPEDEYRGMFTEHGYASHTPVTDGERVFAYFGKTGAIAFDLDGNKLWQTHVGNESDPRGWGSASSPILYKNLVIITASIESQALVALDKDTGKEVWCQEAAGLASTWGTPVLVPIDDQRTDLVLAVPYELWALNPEDGKLRWYCESIPSDSMCSSAVTHDGIVYALESGPRGGGAVAIRAGGKDDVSESHVLWRGQDRSRIGTPVFYEGHLYWISSGIARCIDAKTGESVYEQRLSRPAADAASDTPADDASPEGGGRFGRGGGPGSGPSGGRFGRGGGRGGPGGGSDYASPVVADGKLVFLTRAGNAYVVQLGTEFKELGCNRFSDGGDFSATPAISDGQLFIRSSKYLYCVADSTP